MSVSQSISWSVCIGLSVSNDNVFARMTDTIEMPFGMVRGWTKESCI